MENKSFEENLKELESVVKELENKDISLEDAVKKYTLGLELSKKCYDILNTNRELVAKKVSEAGFVNINKNDL